MKKILISLFLTLVIAWTSLQGFALTTPKEPNLSKWALADYIFKNIDLNKISNNPKANCKFTDAGTYNIEQLRTVCRKSLIWAENNNRLRPSKAVTYNQLLWMIHNQMLKGIKLTANQKRYFKLKITGSTGLFLHPITQIMMNMNH
jgi:hypothetical protein